MRNLVRKEFVYTSDDNPGLWRAPGGVKSVRITCDVLPTPQFSIGTDALNAATSGVIPTIFAPMHLWGVATAGILGDGTTTAKSIPTAVAGTQPPKVAGISVGGRHALALFETGEVAAWGRNNEGQFGNNSTTDASTPLVSSTQKFKQVYAQGDHSFAIDLDGKGFATGNQEFDSVLGVGDNVTRSVWTEISGNRKWAKFAKSAGKAAVFSQSHALAIEAGTLDVYAWGVNTHGCLGLGDTTDRSTPTQIPGIKAKDIAISMGDQQDESGDPYHYSAILTTNNDILTFGSGVDGVLGVGDTTNRSTPTALAVQQNWSKLIDGVGAIDSESNLWVWGPNANGQLGLGDTTDRSTPTQLMGLKFSGAVMTIAGGGGVTLNGEIYRWGAGDSGSLGDGTTTGKSTPTLISGNLRARATTRRTIFSGIVPVTPGTQYGIVTISPAFMFGGVPLVDTGVHNVAVTLEYQA